ncbi:GHKL domain protein [Leptospira kirschneri str. 200803703]|uniref:sensor histidine kinase n=1 Tax=Leptospira kirschneri TaxID=29507 RepID=UPI0002BE959D|nr:HAMP domain-containing sensor histidine kinase [Leptospira kirschneri]EMO68623.1 GHKL domain protein [Leptospira kirschneri str. 200803703]
MPYNFFENFPLPACILEPSLLIQKVNFAFCRTIGYSKEELEGILNWDQICEFKDVKFHFADPSLWPCTNLPSENPSYSILLFTKDGVQKECSVSFAFDREELRIFAYLEVPQVFDKPVVKFDSLKTSVAEKDWENPSAAWVQKEKLDAIGTLSAGVAHEINNPLMGVINYAEMMVNGIENGNPLRKYAGIILREGNRISEIVKDMLTFTRIEKEDIKIHDIKSIFGSALSVIKTCIDKSKIETVVSDPETPIFAACSAGKLRKIYFNLLTNAKDAIESNTDPNQKRVVSVFWEKLKKENRDFIRTIIEDTGIGIPEENRHKLFDPFYTTKDIGKGTGLGLTVSYNLTREMGGELSFESENGVTRFYLDLPESI